MCIYFIFSICHPASHKHKFSPPWHPFPDILSSPLIVLAHVSALTCAPEWDPKCQSKWPPGEKELWHHAEDALGEEAAGSRTSWKTQQPWGCSWSRGSHGRAAQVLVSHPARAWQALTSTTSACLWDHPSSKPPHRLCAKIKSWGRKKCVWSYPFRFFLSPSIPKQMYPFHSPYLQTFCFFEQFLYSEAASLNFA